MNKTISLAIKDFCSLDDEIKILIAQLKTDLYYGSGIIGDDENYPGWESGLKKLKLALSDVRELWVDTFAGGATDTEPEECSEDWIFLDKRRVVEYLVGKDLAEYI